MRSCWSFSWPRAIASDFCSESESGLSCKPALNVAAATRSILPSPRFAAARFCHVRQLSVDERDRLIAVLERALVLLERRETGTQIGERRGAILLRDRERHVPSE